MSHRPDARAIAVAEIAAALEAAGADDPHRLAEAAFDVLEPNHIAWWSKYGQETIPSWSSQPLPVDVEPLFSFRKRNAWSAATPKPSDQPADTETVLTPHTVEPGNLTFAETTDDHAA